MFHVKKLYKLTTYSDYFEENRSSGMPCLQLALHLVFGDS